MLACVPECTSGWARIGISRTRQAHSLCRFGVTLVLELRSSSESIFDSDLNLDPKFRKEEMMNTKHLALLLLFVSPLVPQSQAEIKHIEMHVEGMT